MIAEELDRIDHVIGEWSESDADCRRAGRSHTRRGDRKIR
jgi:hypothetical protein